MGQHIDTRAGQKRKLKENDPAARKRKATFKQYLNQIEEDLINDELEAEAEDLDDNLEAE